MAKRYDDLPPQPDPREAQMQHLLGLPPSPDDIVTSVATAFAGDLARILGNGDQPSRPKAARRGAGSEPSGRGTRPKG